MPLAPVIATQLTTPTSRAASLYIGSRDFTSSLFLETLRVRDVVGNTRSTLEVTLRGAVVDLPELYDQASVRFVDHTAGDEPFSGFLVSKHPVTGIDPAVEIVADHIGSLIDDTFIPFESRPAESMQSRIGYLWGTYAGSHLSGDLSFVANIGGTLLAQDFAGVTLREAIEMTIAQTSATADYHVDPYGRLHVFTSETNDAPYDVVHATPAGGEIAPEDLDINYDSAGFYNRVYVQGANPDGSGFFQDQAAIAAANGVVRTAHLLASDSETAAMANALASLFLARQKAAVARGTFSVESPYDGWRAGQNLTLNDPDIFSAPQVFQIRSVERRFSGRGTNLLHSTYAVEFGARSAGSSGGGGAESLGSGQLVYGNLGGESNVYVTSDGVTVTDGA